MYFWIIIPRPNFKGVTRAVYSEKHNIFVPHLILVINI